MIGGEGVRSRAARRAFLPYPFIFVPSDPLSFPPTKNLTLSFVLFYPFVFLTSTLFSQNNSARILSAQYKALSEKELAKWNKKAEQDKIRYQHEMKSYVPMEDPTGGKRKKQKRDPNAPKRNMSAYFLYSVHIRPTIKANNPDASFGDIARMISAQFKDLPPNERAMWDAKAEADKQRYLAEKEAYEGR